MGEAYTVIDFETTGLSPARDEIIQLGGVRFDADSDEELGRFDQLVQPTHSVISQWISGLTGIWPQDVAGAPMLSEVLPAFLDFIAGSKLVAHNAAFDVGFLYQAMIDEGLRGGHFEVYDTLSEAKKLVRMPNYKLETFKDVLGIELRSHDALNDCLVTARLYQYLKGLD